MKPNLVQENACGFHGDALLGPVGFDRVVLSYSLSLIPEWQGTLHLAAAQLRDRGSLHVVDFCEQNVLSH